MYKGGLSVLAALTPCPSPLAKSAPEEGRVLNFLREIT